MKGYFWYLGKTRIVDSTSHSKPDKKLSRKKRKALQNCKSWKRNTPLALNSNFIAATLQSEAKQTVQADLLFMAGRVYAFVIKEKRKDLRHFELDF
ncbi:hypothetical protein TNCV_3556911 [Trichonephila clavipes]|uniref:Uncharacterized protein n=1 Tax=Trichonephila clavipes TaxID=2585209 RepID=A0A8X6WBX4_TRICX|nr:hypothetical protein TNCV_3556911 [Trichonephila clavipes]